MRPYPGGSSEIGELLLSQTQVIAGAAGSSRCHEWKETHVLSVLQQYNTQKKMVVKTKWLSVILVAQELHSVEDWKERPAWAPYFGFYLISPS